MRKPEPQLTRNDMAACHQAAAIVADRGAGRSRKDSGWSSVARKREGGNVRNSVLSLYGKLRQSSKVLKRDTKLRYVVNPRGVSSDHVLTRVFGDTFRKA